MGPFHSLDIYWADAIQLRKKKVDKESRWERKCHEILNINMTNQYTMCYETRKIKKKKEKKKPFWKWTVRSWIKSGIFLWRIWWSKKCPLQECLVHYLVDLGRELGDRGCRGRRTTPRRRLSLGRDIQVEKQLGVWRDCKHFSISWREWRKTELGN